MTDRDTMHVRPARKGLIVRRPERDGEALPAKGARVPRSAYWMRRLRDGDVETASKPSGGGKQTKES